jgi:outer membrane protein
MKTQYSIFSKSAFVLLVALTVAACNQNKSASAVTTAPVKQAIVWINVDTLTTKYNYIKDMNKRLEDKGKSAQGDVQSRGQAIQREYAEYQRNANTMTNDQRQTTEQRLGREQQDFQQFQQNEAAEFQNVKSQENQKLFDKIAGFSKTYAKDNGYKMVLSYGNGSLNLLFGDPSLDVTNDFVKKLNDYYAKEKK